MEKNWILKPFPGKNKIEALSQAINVSYTSAAILLQRGIETFDEAKYFFRPDLNQLHDPFLMKNMDKAVSRLIQAIQNYEKITIYGDYDVDGTTSVALVYSFLKKFHSNIDFYIPDRYKEGYGISEQGIETAKKEGVSLIITLDCGIKSVDLVEKALEYGIDFIICDHHLPDETLPNAFAVLDAKQPDCQYPYKELSGCGVGFKLMQGFCLKQGIPLEKLYPYLDFVAVSIASDIVAITGENRTMAYFGLKLLNQKPRPGFKALRKVAGFADDKIMNITNVVFGIGPRINAAGRMEHAKLAVQLLLAENEEDGLDLAMKINQNNQDRKTFDSNITEHALEMIEKNDMLKTAKSTVLFHENWHKGVIGIVASRVIEKYHRPTIILTQSNEEYASGSARSVPGFDVHQAILECSELLEKFGGHMYAAGLTLKLDNLEAFKEKFERVVARTITEEMLMPHIMIDLPLDFNQINIKLFKLMDQMAPFGPGNLEPVFMSENVYLSFTPQIMKEKHLKIIVHQAGSDDFEAIGFGMAHLKNKFIFDKPFRLCYHIHENTYNGFTKLQFTIKDIKSEF